MLRGNCWAVESSQFLILGLRTFRFLAPSCALIGPVYLGPTPEHAAWLGSAVPPPLVGPAEGHSVPLHFLELRFSGMARFGMAQERHWDGPLWDGMLLGWPA